MIHGKWLVLDRNCEVYDLLAPYADAYFWDLTTYDIVPNSIIVLDGFCRSKGSLSLGEYVKKIKHLIHTRSDLLFVYCKSSEGGETLDWHIPAIGLGAEALSKKLLIIGGGEMDSRFHCLDYEKFLELVWEIEWNQNNLSVIDKIFSTYNKPYKFLYLSGRAREHRKYLLEKFILEGLADKSLISCLEGKGLKDRGISFYHNGENLLEKERDTLYLPKEYEFEQIRDRIGLDYGTSFIKYNFFNGEWLDGQINPPCYIDTYFSVVAETAFVYPYSFRTEKIWKVIMAGHPWIAVSNKGFYKDIKNLGFKTFNHCIDESFDSIDNCEDRVKKASQIITNLCNQDLNSFLDNVRETCIYNQMHMQEVYTKVRKEFPNRFIDFIGQYIKV